MQTATTTTDKKAFLKELISALNQEAHRNNSDFMFDLLKRYSKFYTVYFARRTKGKNGEQIGDTRKMTCLSKVSKYTNGKGMAYSPKEYALLPVFDVLKMRENLNKARSESDTPLTEEQIEKAGKAAYRNVNLAACFRIDIAGRTLVRDTNQNWKELPL